MKKLLVIVTSALLTSCATYDNVMNKTRDRAIELGESEIRQAQTHTPSGRAYKSIKFSDRLYVPNLEKHERNMPDWYFREWESRSSNLSLSSYMQQIQKAFGINVRYLEQVEKDRKFPMFFKGKLGDAIEQMALATGFTYEIKENVISWSKYKEKTFDLAFLAGEQNFRLGSDKNSQGAGNEQSNFGSVQLARLGNTTDQKSSFSNVQLSKLDQFKELKSTLDILKSNSGKYSLDKSSSMLIVRDLPESVRNIEKFIRAYKKKVTTNIRIDVKVIQFSKSNGVNNSINWEMVNRTLSDAGVATVKSTFSTPLVSTVSPLILGYERTGGTNIGSKVLIQALESQGTVTTISEPTVLTISNRMTNVNIGRDQGFGASSGTSITGGLSNTSQAQITPGLLETGTDLYVYPTLDTETGEITVQLNTSITDFNRFNVFESGTSRIQTPDTSKQKFDLTFVAKSGQTWLVTGYKSKRVEAESNHSGVDVPFLDLLFGGSKRSNDVYRETLLLITPRVLGKF